jgi:hypothetical protein
MSIPDMTRYSAIRVLSCTFGAAPDYRRAAAQFMRADR